MTALSKIERCGLHLLVELEIQYGMAQGGVPRVCEALEQILSLFALDLEEKIGETRPEIMPLVRTAATSILGTSPVARLDSHQKIVNLLTSNCGLVQPMEIEMGADYVETSTLGKEDIVEKNCVATIVPVAKTLQTILENTGLSNMLSKSSIPSSDGILRSVKDGSIFKNHPVCQKYPDALLIAMYEDDVELVNPLGSHTRVHKTTHAYWTILNFPESVRSNLNSIFLLGLAKYVHLKKFGFKSFLADFITAMKCLESDEGLKICVFGEEIVLHGALLAVNGDGLALNSIGGYKESFSFALRPCRNCTLTREEMKTVFVECSLRDKETHKHQVNLIMDPNLNKQQQANMSKEFGVCADTIFTELQNFDPTKMFPQDAMHNLLEGVLDVEIRSLLAFVLAEKIGFTLEVLNHKIKSFPYPSEFLQQIPSVVESSHIENGLRQSASQMLTLLVVLPMILAPFCHTGNELYIKNFCLLVQISHKILAYEVRESSIGSLKCMIYLHHLRFSNLYPAVTITPKFHFLVHTPTVIEQYGPIRTSWCMRYEAKNAWFSKTAKTSHNFKNITKSLANKYQIKTCMEFGYGDPAKIILSSRTFSPSGVTDFSLLGYPLGPQVKKAFGISAAADHVQAATGLSINNIDFAPECVLMYSNDEYEHPMFCKISAILLCNDVYVFVCNLFETLQFDTLRVAYEVKETNTYRCLKKGDFVVQKFPLCMYEGKKFILPMYFDLEEFEG